MRCTASIPNVIVSIHSTQFNCSQSRIVISAALSVCGIYVCLNKFYWFLAFFSINFLLCCSNVHLSLLAFGGFVYHKPRMREQIKAVIVTFMFSYMFRVSSKYSVGLLKFVVIYSSRQANLLFFD